MLLQFGLDQFQDKFHSSHLFPQVYTRQSRFATRRWKPLAYLTTTTLYCSLFSTNRCTETCNYDFANYTGKYQLVHAKSCTQFTCASSHQRCTPPNTPLSIATNDILSSVILKTHCLTLFDSVDIISGVLIQGRQSSISPTLQTTK